MTCPIITGDTNFDLIRWCLSGFIKFLLFPLQFICFSWRVGILRLCGYSISPQTFNLLCLLVWIHEVLFQPISYNLLRSFILMLRLSKICIVGAPSSWFLCPFDLTSSIFEHLGLSCTCPAPTQKSIIPPRSSGPFIEE